MAYKILYSSKDQFYTQASNKFNKWSAELAYVQMTLDRLSNLDGFQGEAADAVKTYFSEVHGTLLKAIKQTINDFYCRLALFAYGYYDIDGQYDAVLPEESFDLFRGVVATEKSYVDSQYKYLSSVISAIQDILAISAPSPHSLIDSMSEANRRVDVLKENVRAYEEAKRSEAYGEVASLIQSLSAAIDSYARSNTAISGYHAGGYASNPFVKELAQNIAASETNTSKFINTLNDILEEIGAVSIEPGQDDLIPPTIDGIVDLKGRTVITAADRIADGSSIPFLAALSSGTLTVNTSGSGISEKTDKSAKGAVLYGQSVETGKFLGMDYKDTAYGDLVGFSASYKPYGSFGVKNKDALNSESKDSIGVGGGIQGNAEGHVAVGELSTDSTYIDGKLGGSFLSAGVEGKAGVCIVDDGKFSPSVEVEVGGKASVLDGEFEIAVGSDDNNIHGKADGTLLGAEAGAGVGAGKITVKDKSTGIEREIIGAKAEAKAEAYLAEGRVSGGIEIFGIDIGIGIEGKAGGAGAGVGGYIGNNGVSGELDVGVIFGVGIDFTVDWSGFKWPF